MFQAAVSSKPWLGCIERVEVVYPFGATLGQVMADRPIAGFFKSADRRAVWRPLEILLYDWWPVLAVVRLSDLLIDVPVRILYRGR
jgi:hypothetical protein